MNPDIINISLDDVNISIPRESASSSPIPLQFNDGIDLLVNKKKMQDSSSSSKSNIQVGGDIQNLEDELNDLTGNDSSGINLFNDILPQPLPQSVSFQEQNNGSSIGQSTANIHENTKTWDGFGKVDAHTLPSEFAMQPHKPPAQKNNNRIDQIKYWKKLESLKKKGIELSRDYSADSSLDEMKCEYDSVIEGQKRDASVRFQQSALSTFVTGIQWISGKWEIANLDGLSDQVAENISDYDDIFEQFHETFSSSDTQHPAVRLMLQLGGSMMMVHMTNTLFKSSMPGLEDMLRQDPGFMREFQTAAMNSMSQKNPGMTNFIRDTNPTADPRPAPRVNTAGSSGGPPPPIRVNSRNAPSPPPDRGGNKVTSRPDLEPSFTSLNTKTMRPEMKGPGDISDILGNIQTNSVKNIHISEKDRDDISTISVQEARELSGNIQQPKKSRRRPHSEKNTASLDI